MIIIKENIHVELVIFLLFYKYCAYIRRDVHTEPGECAPPPAASAAAYLSRNH